MILKTKNTSVRHTSPLSDVFLTIFPQEILLVDSWLLLQAHVQSDSETQNISGAEYVQWIQDNGLNDVSLWLIFFYFLRLEV